MYRARTKPGSAGCAPGSSTTPGSRRRTGICHVSVLCKLIYFRTARAFLALWLFSIWPLSKCGRYRGTLTSREGVILSPVLKVATPFLNIQSKEDGDIGCRIELTVLGTASPSATHLGSPLVFPNRDPRLFACSAHSKPMVSGVARLMPDANLPTLNQATLTLLTSC